MVVIELSDEAIPYRRNAPRPGGAFTCQLSREWTKHLDGFLIEKRFLIHDRDTKWTGELLALLADEDVESVRRPARAPICNAHAGRFLCSMKEECLDRMVLFGEESPRHALRELVEGYHRERKHRGVGNGDGRFTSRRPRRHPTAT